MSRFTSRPSWARCGTPLIALSVVATALAGCSSSEPATSATSAKPARTLNILQGSTPNQFDPCGTPNGSELAYMGAIYAPLIRTDPATGELSPGLATKWETAADQLSLTLTLQTGLTFQDGTPLNAETVKASLDQCIGLKHQDVPGLKTITAEGKDTVVFALSSPASGLVELLGARLGLIASPVAREKEGDGYGANPVGAGPFRMTKFVPGSSVMLEAWADYTEAGLPKPRVARIKVSIITDPSAQVAALTTGAADFGYRMDYTTAAGLEGAPGVTVKKDRIGVALNDINVDRSHGPMKDPKVRQAVSYALDRSALAKAATDGLSDVAALQPYPPGHPYHQDALDNAYPFDPNKARELLAEAGYPHGLKLRGVSLDGADFVANSLVIADQLRAVGIDITFDAKALPDAVKAWYTNHDYDLMSTGMNSGPDWLTIYRRLLTTTSAGNAGKVPLPGGDEAFAAANATTTEKDLLAAIEHMNVVFQEQLPIIPLYYSPIVFGWVDGVTGGEKAFAINGEADFTALGLG